MRVYKILFILILLMLSVICNGCEKDPVSMGDKEHENASEQEVYGLSTIIVTCNDEKGRPLKEGRVALYPDNNTNFIKKQFTNEIGIAVFDSISSGNYTVIAWYYAPDKASIYQFEDYIDIKNNQIIETKFIVPSYGGIIISPINEQQPIITLLIIKDGNIENIQMGIPNISPIVSIISPNDNNYQNNCDIQLIGDGFDIEDGELSFDAYTWYSDIDGELGTGREIKVDRLNIGHHTISLTCTDSNQNETETSIELKVYFFNENTYYPIPYEGYWNYQYINGDFTVNTIQGEREFWSITNLKVSTVDVNTRNSLMEFTITRDDSTKSCLYHVVDYYETDSDNAYVSKTTEQLIIYDDNIGIDEPIEQIDIETDYSPRYLLIKNHMDIPSVSSYDTNVTANVTWSYNYSDGGTITFSENIAIETTYEVGEPETIESELGTFDTVPLTITTGEAVRKWWLAKGIGIVKLEFNTFEFPLSATLYDTNIFSFAENGQAQKYAVSHSYPDHIQKELKNQSNTPERMLELCRLLRGLCPQ